MRAADDDGQEGEEHLAHNGGCSLDQGGEPSLREQVLAGIADSMILVRGGRSSVASSTERSILLGALATHMGVLDSRENDAQTIVRKSELWDEITRQFNAQTMTPRSRQQIQTLYKNMKAKARRYEARLAEVAVGVPPPDPDPISEMLLGLLHQQMQHQRRHLQRLAAGDAVAQVPTSSSSGRAMQHYEANVISPEQVMQISLEEGETHRGIKEELNEEHGSQPHVCAVKSESADECSSSSSPGVRESQETVEQDDYSLMKQNQQKQILQDQTQQEVLTWSLQTQTDCNMEQKKNFQYDPLPYKYADREVSRARNPQSPCYSDDDGNAAVLSPSTAKNSHLVQTQSHVTSSPHPHFNKQAQTHLNLLPTAVHSNCQVTLDQGAGNKPHSTSKRPRLDLAWESSCRASNGMEDLPVSRVSPTLCCCPDLHKALFTMAHQEHQLRIQILKEDSKAKSDEHNAKMTILQLEEQTLRKRMGTDV